MLWILFVLRALFDRELPSWARRPGVATRGVRILHAQGQREQREWRTGPAVQHGRHNGAGGAARASAGSARAA